jgi:nucleoside-specific outer membrane channel protein Tsx
MKKLLLPLCLLLAFVASAMSQETISVDRVNFKSLKDNWVQMEVQLTCNGNPAPDARNRRFVENIKVKAYLGYAIDKSAGEFDFYTSEVEIIIMEQGDDNNVYFYLPGMIVDRDKLSSTDPDYYFVEVYVNGELQPSESNARSSSISNETILSSMKAKAEAEGAENDFILMPIYYVPSDFLGRVDKLPTFLRRDVRD